MIAGVIAKFGNAALVFDTSTSQQPVAYAIDWIADTLLGQTAVTICVLAVAFVGFSMLTGRISVRRGGQVILGCFILLGAPAIAISIMGLLGPSTDSRLAPADTVVYEAQPREELTPANNSPYTGASSRRRSD